MGIRQTAGADGPVSSNSVRASPEIRRFTFESDLFSAPCAEIEIEGKRLRFVESSRQAFKRVETIFSKEPTTIPWLDAIRPEESLVDIGANIGIYTIYAAAMTGCNVYAFEPEALNYAELNKNIFVNGFHDRVRGFCLAMSDEERIDYLMLGGFGFSYSHHDFGENTWKDDKRYGESVVPRDGRLLQGSVAVPLDVLIERGVIPVPQHIKVDVDGLEHRVFRGARQTLTHPDVRSVLIEIDHTAAGADDIIDGMREMGWKFSMSQLRTNRKVVLTQEQVERWRIKKYGGFNYIFFRDPDYEKLFDDFLEGYHAPWADGKKS